VTTREDIAAALTASGLVVGSPYRPKALAPGQAWPGIPRLEATEAGWAYLATWRVYVVLPTVDEQARAMWFDDHARDLIDALRSVLFVDSIEVDAISTDAGDIPVAVITGRSE
jgi:hypothetical protein